MSSLMKRVSSNYFFMGKIRRSRCRSPFAERMSARRTGSCGSSYRAIPDMFKFIDHPDIPKTIITEGL